MELTLHETTNPRQGTLTSITPQMIYRFTRLIWFFLLLKIQTRRPAHERPQQLFYCHGIPSLFLIFSVLCLAVLSLLTLGNSRSELNTARNSMQQTEDYYNACSQASTVINEIQTELTDAYRQATDQKNYLALVGQFCKDHSELTFDEEKQTLLFAESLSDTQQLTVCLKVLYPEKSGDSLIQILQWKTDTTASWTPDTSQSVYKGGTHE